MIFQLSIRVLIAVSVALWLGIENSQYWGVSSILFAIAGIWHGVRNKESDIRPICVGFLVLMELVIVMMLILQVFASPILSLSLLAALILLIFLDGIPRKWDRNSC